MPVVFGGYRVDQQLIDALSRGRIFSIESATQVLRSIGTAPRDPRPMDGGSMLWQKLHASHGVGQVILEVSEGPLVTPLHTYLEGGRYGIKILGFGGAVEIVLRDGSVHEVLSGNFVRELPPRFEHSTRIKSLFVGILHLPQGVTFCR